MLVDFKDRTFQLWEYTVSHAQLLMRSVKSDRFNTRIDLLFKGVAMIQIPTLINGLSVRETDLASVPKDCKLIMPNDSRLFHLAGDGRSGYIVASCAFWEELDAEFWDESKMLAGEAEGIPL